MVSAVRRAFPEDEDISSDYLSTDGRREGSRLFVLDRLGSARLGDVLLRRWG